MAADQDAGTMAAATAAAGGGMGVSSAGGGGVAQRTPEEEAAFVEQVQYSLFKLFSIVEIMSQTLDGFMPWTNPNLKSRLASSTHQLTGL